MLSELIVGDVHVLITFPVAITLPQQSYGRKGLFCLTVHKSSPSWSGGGESWQQELEAVAHLALVVKKQRMLNIWAQLAGSIFFSVWDVLPRGQSHSQLRWVFSLQLT